MWTNRIVVVVGIAVIGFAAVDAVRSSDQRKAKSIPTSTTATAPVASIHRCAHSDLAVTIDTRRPRRSQFGAEAGDYEVHAPRHRRIATVVARNTSARGCLLVLGDLRLTIRDRRRRLVAKWLSASWFVHTYAPGSERTFSLPDTYRCDRPGPYLATATVGLYTARRDGLSSSEITC
jgi:hypothetical protein